MRGHGPVTTSERQAARPEWLEPIRDGMNKHRRFIWIKRGGTASSSGSGPQGRKATRRALLSRAMAERAGVAQAVTARQAARVAEKARPLAIIWPDRAKEGWPHA
jgi:hypothetical protein